MANVQITIIRIPPGTGTVHVSTAGWYLQPDQVDTDGNQLGDDEGEGQTSFYLWYIDSKTETDEQGNQKTTDVTKYCVYVDRSTKR